MLLAHDFKIVLCKEAMMISLWLTSAWEFLRHYYVPVLMPGLLHVVGAIELLYFVSVFWGDIKIQH